jgi:hypothetical protein
VAGDGYGAGVLSGKRYGLNDASMAARRPVENGSKMLSKGKLHDRSNHHQKNRKNRRRQT